MRHIKIKKFLPENFNTILVYKGVEQIRGVYFEKNRNYSYKVYSFFLGWAIVAFTLAFWLAEKRNVKLYIVAKIIHFDRTNQINLFPVWVLAAFLNTIMQELLVRGYLYQMLKQKHNIIVATIVTTALFTALHGGAFEAGVIPILNVLTMSLLMTVTLEYSGSIIAPVIMHFLWNEIGALVLGGVSLADDYPNLFVTTFTGNDILFGGVCKIEGSFIVLIVNVVLIALFGFIQKRKIKA